LLANNFFDKKNTRIIKRDKRVETCINFVGWSPIREMALRPQNLDYNSIALRSGRDCSSARSLCIHLPAERTRSHRRA
jgi:hypothetical protein